MNIWIIRVQEKAKEGEQFEHLLRIYWPYCKQKSTISVRIDGFLTDNFCGNKMPTRCNRGFYCRSYCLLNMFRASLCPSSAAQEYYTVVAVCDISCCGFQVAGLVWSWVLCVRFAGMLQHLHQTNNLKTTARSTTGSNHLYNALELLMMVIVVPETCWASNKICNKNLCCV